MKHSACLVNVVGFIVHTCNIKSFVRNLLLMHACVPAGIPGKMGPAGTPGSRGIPGKEALPGMKGPPGDDGRTGASGRRGLPGKTVSQ